MSAQYRNPIYVNPVMELLDPVVSGLIMPEWRRLDAILKALILKNFTAGGHEDGFLHGGETYCLKKPFYLRGAQISPIHFSLFDDAEFCRQCRDDLKRDIKKLRQSLTVVLPRCRDKQDLRDAFPEVLIRYIPELQSLARSREEGHLLESTPVLHRQFEQAVKIALAYTANQLIY